ncbi:MAG: transporter substrate-binding domain-containing protein [Clostridium sp.]|nr:transporter substrate-binding domain-containing protein [Clostridium sp.]
MMKSKMIRLALCVFLLVPLFTGCGSASGASAGGTSGKPVLKVGMECAYAPFNWTQSEQEVSNGDQALPIYGTSDYAYGYDVMLAKKLADQLGMELEIHKVDWSSIVLGLNSGDYDAIIAGMGYTEEREQNVDFTDPYYIRDTVIVVKKDGSFANATALSDFQGASATTQIGTIWEQYVPQIPEVKPLTYYETTSEVIMAVSMGTADCGVLDEPTSMSAAISNPDLTYVKLEGEGGFAIPEGQSLDVCIAVKTGNTELREKLDSALDAIDWKEEDMKELMDLAVTLQPLGE